MTLVRLVESNPFGSIEHYNIDDDDFIVADLLPMEDCCFKA